MLIFYDAQQELKLLLLIKYTHKVNISNAGRFSSRHQTPSGVVLVTTSLFEIKHL
jgi:hypothetical protein